MLIEGYCTQAGKVRLSFYGKSKSFELQDGYFQFEFEMKEKDRELKQMVIESEAADFTLFRCSLFHHRICSGLYPDVLTDHGIASEVKALNHELLKERSK